MPASVKGDERLVRIWLRASPVAEEELSFAGVLSDFLAKASSNLRDVVSRGQATQVTLYPHNAFLMMELYFTSQCSRMPRDSPGQGEQQSQRCCQEGPDQTSDAQYFCCHLAQRQYEPTGKSWYHVIHLQPGSISIARVDECPCTWPIGHLSTLHMLGSLGWGQNALRLAIA